jgi:hypothetical protein
VSNATIYSTDRQIFLAGFQQSNVVLSNTIVTDVYFDSTISSVWYVRMGVIAAPLGGATDVAYYVNYYVTP